MALKEKRALLSLREAVVLTEEVTTSTSSKGAHGCLPAEGYYLKSSSKAEDRRLPSLLSVEISQGDLPI